MSSMIVLTEREKRGEWRDSGLPGHSSVFCGLGYVCRRCRAKLAGLA